MTQTITTRDFLRENRRWRSKLVSGVVDFLNIPIPEGGTLKITYEAALTPFDRLMEMIRKKPWKGLKRPKQDIF